MSKYRLSKLNFTSAYFSAFECVLNGEKPIYCSSELTTGRRLFGELRKRGLKADWELKRDEGEAWFGKHIMGANVKEATLFAVSVRNRPPVGTLVLNPGPLKISGWGQSEYMAFWEELIRTRVKAVHFNSNWEYSNGCTYESWLAFSSDIRTFDSNGNQLSLAVAIASVQGAVEQLRRDGFDTDPLQENLRLLQSLAPPPPTNGAEHRPSAS